MQKGESAHMICKQLQNELPVMELFHSVQGEGFHSGRAASFIRIGGCDVGCHWCDVKESWDASIHPLTPIGDIMDFLSQSPNKHVVVTGGEPLRYDLSALSALLWQNGFKTFLETSGSGPLSGKWHWICLSPKKKAPPHSEVLRNAMELKVIIYNRNDLDWAESFRTQVPEDCQLFLQPEWSHREKAMEMIVAHVHRHPHWRISLQMHKYLHIP